VIHMKALKEAQEQLKQLKSHTPKQPHRAEFT
jgi:hypothetical protein